jgi:hypothetical protein
MEEKYKKFLEFNWRDSADWQAYFSNIYPTPPGNKVDFYKRKFYNQRLDPDFDRNYQPAEPSSSTTNNTSNNASGGAYTNSTYPQPAAGLSSPLIQVAEVGLWVSFLFSIVLNFHTLKFAAAALLIRSIRRVGIPKFSMDWAQLLFLDEHFQQMLYALLFMIDNLNFFLLVPLGITAVLNISEFLKTQGAQFNFLMPYINKIVNKRVELAKTRSDIEVGIGFFLFVGIFLGLNSFLLPIFYWQYLRFKYIVNADTKGTFSKMNDYVNIFKNKPSTPGLIKMVIIKVQEFASYMGRTEAGPGQGAGGANCMIF